MLRVVTVEIDMPDDLKRFRLPPGVNARLQELLDRQDRGIRLSKAERKEAEGLVSLAELLSLLRRRAERAKAHGATQHAGGLPAISRGKRVPPPDATARGELHPCPVREFFGTLTGGALRDRRLIAGKPPASRALRAPLPLHVLRHPDRQLQPELLAAAA